MQLKPAFKMMLNIYMTATEFLLTVVLIEATQYCQNCLGGTCNEDSVCTDGCVPGFYDKHCNLNCPSSCIALKCEVDGFSGATVCSEGCEDGYCGNGCRSSCERNCLKCNRNTCSNCTKCRSGLHGKECESSCYEKCQGFECSIDGLCLTTCSNGWYGSNCSRPCNLRCATCDRTSGECTTCLRGMYGDACEHHCPDCLPEPEEHRYNSQSGCVNCPIKVSDTSTPDTRQSKCPDEKIYVVVILSVILISIIISLMCHASNVVRTCSCGGKSNNKHEKSAATNYHRCNKFGVQECADGDETMVVKLLDPVRKGSSCDEEVSDSAIDFETRNPLLAISHGSPLSLRKASS